MKAFIFIGLFAVLLFPAHALSGPCNCELIYDEFDSLMNKEFLLNPGKYLPTRKVRLSRQEYEKKQKGVFVLNPQRQGLGIAIIHTNRNTWGKLLFTWRPNSNGGQPLLLIREIQLFGRVKDGYRPRKYTNRIIRSSFTLDADTGNLRNPGKQADIWFHNLDGRTMYIEAVNGAHLEFPLASLCADTKSRFSARPKPRRIADLRFSNRPLLARINADVLERLKHHENQIGCPTEKRVLPDGTVEIRYPDGRIERRSENGTVIVHPDGRREEHPKMIPYSLNVQSASAPESPSTEAEALWLGFHAEKLLGIIASILKDGQAIAQYEEFEGQNLSVFEAIETRRRTIDYLVSP